VVVAGVGAVEFSGIANILQGVYHDQFRLRLLVQERADLFRQSIAKFM
jgi:hypothetical protein